MPKMKYVGPGSDNDKRTMDVQDNEVDSLEATGLWKPVRAATTKKEKPDG